MPAAANPTEARPSFLIVTSSATVRTEWALVAQHQGRRHRVITAALSRLERTAGTAVIPLAVGPALTVILLLALGLWALILAAVALAMLAFG